LKTRKKRDKVGVQDIAAYLNISASTVSRALNDHPRISKETKERVMAAATKLGYHPGIPELMAPEKVEAVAVILPSLDTAFHRELAAGITNYFSLHHYHTFIIDSQGDLRKEELFLKTHKKYGLSGIIHLVSNKNLSPDFYSPALHEKLPLVTVCEPEQETGISSVLPDMFQGFYKIVNYVKTLNIRSIMLILEDPDNTIDSHLSGSLTDAVETAYPELESLHIHYYDRDTGSFSKQIKTLLDKKEMPELLLVKDTLSALEVYSLAERKGIKIPEDFLLVAIGSDYKLETLGANLSLLKLPGFALGNEAAEMLYKQIKDPGNEKQSSILPVNFILKSSSIRLD